MARNVLAVAEIRDGSLRNVSLEALAAARTIAAGGSVAAVLFGSQADRHVQVLGQYGADQVIVVSNPELDAYNTDAYFQALLQVMEKAKPQALLMPHTSLGKDLAPRIAARLRIGLISDVTEVRVEEGEMLFVRPIYAGKAFEEKRVVDGIPFATIRPNNIPAVDTGASAAEKVEFTADIKDLRTIVREVVRKTAGHVDLTEAKVIISGGRGVKSADGFKALQELAEVLGGAVGASRGACDAGYCDYSLQIGQTGKVVTPQLYIAAGISGAIQHLAGMSNSKVIVAINKDPEAPIFQVADYGIVGDLFEVIPMLTEELKQLLCKA